MSRIGKHPQTCSGASRAEAGHQRRGRMRSIGVIASAYERRQPGLLAALPPCAPCLYFEALLAWAQIVEQRVWLTLWGSAVEHITSFPQQANAVSAVQNLFIQAHMLPEIHGAAGRGESKLMHCVHACLRFCTCP